MKRSKLLTLVRSRLCFHFCAPRDGPLPYESEGSPGVRLDGLGESSTPKHITHCETFQIRGDPLPHDKVHKEAGTPKDPLGLFTRRVSKRGKLYTYYSVKEHSPPPLFPFLLLYETDSDRETGLVQIGKVSGSVTPKTMKSNSGSLQGEIIYKLEIFYVYMLRSYRVQSIKYDRHLSV